MEYVFFVGIGMAAGFLVAKVRTLSEIRALEDERDGLARKLERLTDRDERGRFKK